MKIRIRTPHFHLLASALCGLCISACVQSVDIVADIDKYIQWVDPLGGLVTFQIEMPSGKACAYALQSFRKDATTPGSSFWRCASKSASDQLPFVATIKNPIYKYALNVETLSLTWCESFTKQLVVADPSMETQRACQARTSSR